MRVLTTGRTGGPSARREVALRRIGAALLFLLAALLVASPAEGQYFGKNKVQYESFDFEVMATPHFDVYFYADERRAVGLAGRMAERWYARFSPLLDHRFDRRQPLILYASHPHFQQTDVVQGMIGEGISGLTESLQRRIVMPFAGALAETDHVLGHEIVHAFQYDIAGERGRRLPLWFVEGMAEYLSVGPRSPQSSMWLRDALAHDRLPAIDDLDDPDYFPYRFGHAFLAYVAGLEGDEAIAALLRSRNPDAALVRITGVPLEDLSDAWHRAIREQYAPLREATAPPERFGRRLFDGEEAGEIQVAPALSPDGSKIAFLSERSQFGIELYVADVSSGEVERKLTEMALDPHYNSLEFTRSAGAWHPDGRGFVFSAVSEGQPVLTVVDTDDGRVRFEKRFPALGQILNPTFSPDGRAVAFSAIEGGLLDLFMYDVEQDRLTRLTDDAFAELHPDWSPDGETIVYATDRFTSDLDDLAFGEYRLALLRVSDRSVRQVPGPDRGMHLNPQWAPGGLLYFMSNETGIPNVHRLDPATGRSVRITDLFTGVSGITPQSPAISIADATGELAFSVLEDGGYGLYVQGTPRDLEAQPATLARFEPAQLPPAGRRARVVFLGEPEAGLPPPIVDYPVNDYAASLSLDYVAQPTVIAGAGPFGTFFGGGTALYFSDMLGRHRLGAMAQLNGGLDNLALGLAYQNSSRRLMWGGGAQRSPVVFLGYTEYLDTVAGQPALVQEETVFRETTHRVAGNVRYPFSRALRVDLAAGYRNISFDQDVRMVAFSAVGEVLREETESRSFESLNLGEGSAALVYDNAVLGATSPVAGQRARFEGSPIFGSLNYVEGLADYRRYVMPVRPLTLAFRILHFGLYGGDAEDPRVRNLFVGAPGLIRGYGRGSFDDSECVGTPGDPCPVFNQLLGSRIAVANAEVRFPLLGILGIGDGFYGGLPLEMAFFGDAGVAWRDDRSGTPADDTAFFLGGDRDPVYSAGVTLRFNLGGYMVLQYDFARAFERDRWVSQFGLVPGF